MTADAPALQTIISNLLDNAVKACAAGDGRNIAITAERAGRQIQLTVTDDGAGFPAEDAELIFEKFYRSGDEMRRATPGTGLGLYISRELCELNRATLLYLDRPGGGSIFRIVFADPDRWESAES